MRPNAAGVNVKLYKKVKTYDGNKNFVHELIRDALKSFNAIAIEIAWSDTQKFDNFTEDVLYGDIKDLWESACEEGNRPNDPIDPENPEEDNFDIAVVDFIGKIADQKWPGSSTWEYLQGLRYNDILKKHLHKPSVFLRNIKKMEGHCDQLAMVAGTVLTEEVIKELFFWAFNEVDCKRFDQMDNNGQNKWTEMERKEVAIWMDACMTKQVTDAKKAVQNKNHNRDNDGPGNNNNGYKKGCRWDKKRKGGGGNGHDDDNSFSKKSNNSAQTNFANFNGKPYLFHIGHLWKECNGNPWKGNDNFKERVCLNILKRDDIKDFQWYLRSVEKFRPLTYAEGGVKAKGKPKGKRKSGQSQQQVTQQPQQQQYQFAPPVDMPPMVPQQPMSAPPGYAYMMQPALVISQQQATGIQQQNSYMMQPAPVMSQQQPTLNAVTSGGGRWVLANGQYMFV